MNCTSSNPFPRSSGIVFLLYMKYQAKQILTVLTMAQSMASVRLPDYCLIHFDGDTGQLARFTEHAYKKVLECSEIWRELDGEQRKIAEQATFLEYEEVKNSKAGYHRGCYSKFTNKTFIKRAITRREKAKLQLAENDVPLDDLTSEDCGKYVVG